MLNELFNRSCTVDDGIFSYVTSEIVSSINKYFRNLNFESLLACVLFLVHLSRACQGSDYMTNMRNEPTQQDEW